MLMVDGHYKYFYSYSAGIDFRRQIPASEVDPRTVRVNLGVFVDNPAVTNLQANKHFTIHTQMKR